MPCSCGLQSMSDQPCKRLTTNEYRSLFSNSGLSCGEPLSLVKCNRGFLVVLRKIRVLLETSGATANTFGSHAPCPFPSFSKRFASCQNPDVNKSRNTREQSYKVTEHFSLLAFTVQQSRFVPLCFPQVSAYGWYNHCPL